jgi:hypothetical protein
MAFGDVCLLFGMLLSLGIAFPGLLVAWTLLLPDLVGRAGLRLARTPGRCLGLGAGWLAVCLVLFAVLLAVPGLGVALGWFGIVGLFTIASIGAAGLAVLMGDRLRQGGTVASPVGAALRGAIALELAAIFPLIGWFVVLPVIALSALGAAGFALLRWLPGPDTPPSSPIVAASSPHLPAPSPGGQQVATMPVAWPESGVGHGFHTP